jgi:hypothetical protein
LTLGSLLSVYFKIIIALTLVVGIASEVYAKGTILNKGLRHYFGMPYFVEYTAKDPLGLPFDPEVPICDYEKITLKIFFNEYVARERPCLFKNYGKLWPAYGKW